MKLERTALPSALTTNFISVANAATQIEGDATYDNTKLTRDISAVYYQAERYCERAFLNQTWVLELDGFPTARTINPDASIFLPRGKVQSITSATYLDEDGNQQSLTGSGTDYYLDNRGDIARMYPIADGWPKTDPDQPNTVTVTYVAGFGTSLPDDKNDILSGCLLALGDLYETRQSKTPVSLFDSKLWESFLHDYKIYFDFELHNDG